TAVGFWPTPEHRTPDWSLTRVSPNSLPRRALVTTPKINTLRRGGARYYVNPETGDKVPGVTSIVGMLPKEFLKFWAAKSVATAAVDMLGEVVGIALRDRDAA